MIIQFTYFKNRNGYGGQKLTNWLKIQPFFWISRSVNQITDITTWREFETSSCSNSSIRGRFNLESQVSQVSTFNFIFLNDFIRDFMIIYLFWDWGPGSNLNNLWMRWFLIIYHFQIMSMYNFLLSRNILHSHLCVCMIVSREYIPKVSLKSVWEPLFL